MRILFVHHNSDLYGSSRSLVRLLQHLDRNKFTPLVVLAEDGPLRDLIEKLGVPVLFHPTLSVITRPVFKSWRLFLFLLNFPRAVFHLRKIIIEHKISLVHTNSGVIVSSGMAAKLAGVPHIWHLRDWFQEFGAVWPIYARYILWSSKAVIAISAAVARQLPLNKKTIVIHNGFSLSEFALPKAELRERFRENYALGKEFVVGCVGRIKLVRKGQEILVKAAAVLAQRGIQGRYLIVGAPFKGNESHLAEIKRLACELKVQDFVTFTGELPDPRPAYAAMDISVLTSIQPEPLGGVVMESMAMSVPVIATNVGGPIEMIEDGKTGFLVPPGDAEALADKIELLMTDTTLRQRIADAGPRHVEENFSLEKMARRIESVYQETAGSLVTK